MTKIFFSTLLLIIISIGSSADAARYSVCATNADGAILVDERDGDNTSFALASSPTSFTHTAFGNTTKGGHCDVTTDFYKVKIFQFGLCKEMPYQVPEDSADNTIGADLSLCTLVFDKAAGKELIIEPGKGMSFQRHFKRSELWLVSKGSCVINFSKKSSKNKEKKHLNMYDYHLVPCLLYTSDAADE